MSPDRDYADHLENLWQRDADLGDLAEVAGLTYDELLAQRKADVADAKRDRQREGDDERERNGK